MGKGENAGYQHFLLFPHCFRKAPFSRMLKVGIVWQRVNPSPYGKELTWFKVPIAANKKEFVYKIKVNPIHTILKYSDYHDFMDR